MPIETGKFNNSEGFYDSNHKINLLTALAKSAEELTGGQGWPAGIHSLLKNLGQITGVSRVWIFQIMKLTSEHITQDYTFEWAAKPEYIQIGMSKFTMFTNTLEEIEYSDLINSRKKGEWQKVIVKNLKPGLLKTDQELQGIKSMLTIPIFLQNRWWGTLGFDDCERDHNWSATEVALLRVGGSLIANAVLNTRLDASRKQFSFLQNITDSSLWSLDFQTQHIHLINNLSDITVGLSVDNELPLRSILRIFHPDDRKRLLQFMRDYDLTDHKSIRLEIRIQSKKKSYKWIEIVASISFDSHNRPVQCAGIAIDITQRKHEEAKLRQEAATDPLTGIINRRVFHESFKQLLKASEQNKKPLSLFVLDIDFFKYVNDTWGHDCGDNVLIHMVSVVSQMLRENDIFARLGGEEFAVLLPGTNTKQAAKIGNRIRMAIAESPYTYNKDTIPITVSIGSVTHHCDSREHMDNILIAADQALYKAKGSGRNRLCQSDKRPSSL
jgi:diguanylate cyclase (GGDEF)-like protein/PAS domain S-box-containing protein